MESITKEWILDWNNILDAVELIVIDEHRCDNMMSEDTAVLKCNSSFHHTIRWRVAKVWIAGSEEVEDGEADEIGEIKNLTTIPIVYCPFCGEHLQL
jgi:hypothetical protein